MATIADIIAQAVEGGRRNALAAFAFKQQQMAQAEKTRREDQAALFSIAEDLNPRRARAKLNLLLSVRKIDPKSPGVKVLNELITSADEEMNSQAKDLIKKFPGMTVNQMVDALSTEEGKREVFKGLMKKSEPFKLSQGQSMFPAQGGSPIASAPPAPGDIINLQSPDGKTIKSFRKNDPIVDVLLKNNWKRAAAAGAGRKQTVNDKLLEYAKLIESGKQLTPAQRRAYDFLRRANPMARLEEALLGAPGEPLSNDITEGLKTPQTAEEQNKSFFQYLFGE